MKRFNVGDECVDDIEAVAATELAAAAADVALILDRDGTIRDVAVANPELAAETDGRWVGQPWSATTTVESRPQVCSLLADAAAGRATRWRQVNHLAVRGGHFPILYSVVRTGKCGRLIAVGRDLRAVGVLEQKLIEARQAVDREHARLRNAEARNRLLFELASEGVLIVDASTMRIVDGNPAALQLLGLQARRAIGRPFPEGFDVHGTQAIAAMLSNVRATGRVGEARGCLADGREVLVAASVFREERSTLLLVRATPLDTTSGERAPHAHGKYIDLVEASPDGCVVTDADGHVLGANASFLDLVGAPNEERVLGESLECWLGRPGVDLHVLFAQLRDHEQVRHFTTTLRAVTGATLDVELSAAALPGGEPPCFGFTVREVGAPVDATREPSSPLSRSVEQLTGLVGRVPLKGIVRETSETIERLCIETALGLTRDNRASAAEMLGLSRQSLYVKLRRYGLGHLVDSEGGF